MGDRGDALVLVEVVKFGVATEDVLFNIVIEEDTAKGVLVCLYRCVCEHVHGCLHLWLKRVCVRACVRACVRVCGRDYFYLKGSSLNRRSF